MLDEAVEKLITTSKRTLSEAYDYVKDAARRDGRHGLITVSSREVYEWICEFYNMSEDKYRQMYSSVDTETETSIANDTNTSEKNIPVVTVLPVKFEKKENSDEMEGQMDIFDFI